MTKCSVCCTIESVGVQHTVRKGGGRLRYRIAEARQYRGLSQKELSEKSGVSRTIISELETGKTTVTTTKTLERIARALDMRVADLFFAEKV